MALWTSAMVTVPLLSQSPGLQITVIIAGEEQTASVTLFAPEQLRWHYLLN
jgi:hypothetical protein